MVRKRKIPLRICVGCQAKKVKKEMMRIVRTPEGLIAFDEKGKMPGRGAYICPAQNCLKSALKGKRLEKNLEAALSAELLEKIESMLENNNGIEGINREGLPNGGVLSEQSKSL